MVRARPGNPEQAVSNINYLSQPTLQALVLLWFHWTDREFVPEGKPPYARATVTSARIAPVFFHPLTTHPASWLEILTLPCIQKCAQFYTEISFPLLQVLN